MSIGTDILTHKSFCLVRVSNVVCSFEPYPLHFHFFNFTVHVCSFCFNRVPVPVPATTATVLLLLIIWLHLHCYPYWFCMDSRNFRKFRDHCCLFFNYCSVLLFKVKSKSLSLLSFLRMVFVRVNLSHSLPLKCC